MRPLPEGLLATLDALEGSGPAAILLRHADRDPFAPGEDGTHAKLTYEGAERAEALGRFLRHRAGLRAETSPLHRCRHTAERILAGAAVAASIADNTLLGAPGPFVVDGPGGRDLFLSIGTEGVVRGQIAGEKWPPMRTTAEGLALVVNDLQQRLRELGGTLVCVSHDAIIMPIIAALTGECFVGTWLEPLDGIAFALGRGEELVRIWRGWRTESGT